MCQGLASLRGVGAGRILLAVLSASVSLAQTKADLDLDQYYRRMQCGEVSLAVICRYYNVDVTLEKIDVLCGGTLDGVTANSLVEAARQLGLKATALEANVAYLRRQNGPAIINYPSNHFCVFLGWKNGRAQLYDPPFGLRSIAKSDLRKFWNGKIVFFDKSVGP